MNAKPMPTEQDLQAYVDGWLPPAQQAAVEGYLADRPEEAARIHDYRLQSMALRMAMRNERDAIIPERLLRAARRGAVAGRTVGFARGIAAAVLLAIGFAGGWAFQEFVLVSDGGRFAGAPSEGDLPRLAAAAHRVYAADVRRPVEVRAEEENLLGWLSKRLGRPLNAPNLDTFGFRLMGGRLLPAASGAAAQLMYEDGGGRRITVYVQGNPRGTETAFRFVDEGGLGAFYWRDGSTGYALVGPLQRTELFDIAQSVYQQIEM